MRFHLGRRLRLFLGITDLSREAKLQHEQVMELHVAHAVEIERLKAAVADLRGQLDLPPMMEVDEDIARSFTPSGDPQMGA